MFNQPLLSIIYVFIIIAPAIIASQYLSKRFKNINSSNMSYKWGFYCGSQFIMISILFIILTIIDLTNEAVASDSTSILIELAISLFFAFLGIFTIKRRIWAFVILTILTINPVTWIINGIYIRNRKNEFKNENKLKKLKNSTKQYR